MTPTPTPSVTALVLQTGLAPSLLRMLVRIVGLVVLAGGLGVVVGSVHRWYARERVPEGLAVLVGLAVVAIYLNTTPMLGEVIGGDTDAFALDAALFNISTFLLSGVAAAVGGRAGDRLGGAVLALSGGRRVETDVRRLVRTVGRVTPVDLPEEVADMEGFDPVAPDVKDKLAGLTLVFPRRLTVEELRERLVSRLKADYGVGHVDVDLTADGEVEYLAVGSRESGLGPTLPPGSAAVAVRADPAFAASAGDIVQVWSTGAGAERVTNAEVRGIAGDVVTLSVDDAEADRLDPAARYRLVTLPVEPRADREFASLLRAAEETMGVVTLAAGSPLVGTPVGAIDVALVAVRDAGGGIEAIPPRTRTLAAGETVYAIARPDRLRRLETAAADAPAAVDTGTRPDAVTE